MTMIIGLTELPLLDIGPITIDGGLETTAETPLDAEGSNRSLASPAGTVDFTITFSGPRKSRRAYAIDQLLNAPNIAPFAVTGLASAGVDGYYNASSTTRDSELSQQDDDRHDYEEVAVTLEHVGTHNSHFRALATKTVQVDHEFGNDLDAYVALPGAARKTRWFDSESGVYEPTAAIDSRESDFGTVEIFDVDAGRDALDVDDPTLLYELDYAEEPDASIRVYDTLGHAEKYDKSGIRKWVGVTSTRHDVEDALVIDTGALRVRFDETAGAIEAEQWDADAGEWDPVELDDSIDWSLVDIDVTAIGSQRVTAQVEFVHPDEGLFDLDMAAALGNDVATWSIPENETGPVPDGIEDWLGPIASERLVDAQPTKGLVSRSEVRQ